MSDEIESNESGSEDAGATFVRVGDPRHRPDGATFSRIVLPFRYSARPLGEWRSPNVAGGVPHFASHEDADRYGAMGRKGFFEPLRSSLPPTEAGGSPDPWNGIRGGRATSTTWPTGPDSRWYFTPEITRVLYDRAKAFEWRRWEDKPPGSPDTEDGHHESSGFGEWPRDLKDNLELHLPPISVGGDPRVVEVRQHAPRIVLFEFEEILRAGKRGEFEPEDQDPFHVGFLILDISLADGQMVTFADWLLINERLRYWRPPFELHPSLGMGALFGKSCFGNPEAGEEEKQADLHTCYRERFERWLNAPVIVDSNEGEAPMQWEIVAAEPMRSATAPAQGSSLEDPRGVVAHADDRAFVWTCAVLESPSTVAGHVGDWARLKLGLEPLAPESQKSPLTSGPGPHPNDHALIPRGAGLWIRLLNVDSPRFRWVPRLDPTGSDSWSTIDHRATASADSLFETHWAAERTYTRWAHCGALQGFTVHSGAMLTGPIGEPPTIRHFAGPYFDQTLLLLYTRIVSFQFSRSLSGLSEELGRNSSSQWGPDHQHEDLATRFGNLRMRFALFTNLYEYPLLSNQQQGIELLAIAKERMDIPVLFREIQQEIYSFDDFLARRSDSRLNRTAGYIGSVAIGMGVFALAVDFSSVIAPEGASSWERWGFMGAALLISLAVTLSLLMLFSPPTKSGGSRNSLAGRFRRVQGTWRRQTEIGGQVGERTDS